ncbi:MAG: hypothetical protein IMX02_06855 [Limnochordaceae bacterium]|nr:hypothetical protein [Limnochordaceae bacterium]
MGMNPISFSGDRLRFFGFASGLDIDEIVQKLMTVERIPVDRLEQRRQLLVWTKQDYWAIRRGLDELRNAVSPLKYSSTFAARKATSTNEAVAVASVSAGAPEGVYTVKVTQLAQGIQVASSGAITRSPTGDRTSLWTQFGIDSTASPTIDLTLTVTDSQGVQHTKTLSFSAAAGDDINDVVAAINNAGLGVTAAYDATLDRLFLSSKETGSKVQLTVTDQAVTLSGGGTANVWADLFKLPTTASGQDAVFDLNGATGLQEPTNQFTIAGVTYDLRGVGHDHHYGVAGRRRCGGEHQGVGRPVQRGPRPDQPGGLRTAPLRLPAVDRRPEERDDPRRDQGLGGEGPAGVAAG